MLKKSTTPAFAQRSSLGANKTAMLKKGTTPTLVQKSTLNPGKTALLKKVTTSGFVHQTSLKPAKLNFAKLPVHKAVADKAHIVGRLTVPKNNFKPKLALAHAPKADAQLRLAPFVQRHWKKAILLGGGRRRRLRDGSGALLRPLLPLLERRRSRLRGSASASCRTPRWRRRS